MREFGEYLKQMREAQGLSLQEVSEETKIRLEYLEALEESILEKLPPEIYIKGYIKAYGELLGVDLHDLFARYEDAKPKKSKLSLFQRSKPKATAPIATSKILRKHRKSSKQEKPEVEIHQREALDSGGLQTKQIMYAFLVVLAIIIIVATIKFFTKTDTLPEPVNLLIEKNATDDLPLSESPFTYEDVLQEVILPMRNIDPSWAIGRADSLTIGIRVRQKTWMYVEADYQPIFRGNVEPGNPLKFRAKNAFFLTVTKPELVAMEINGFDLVPGDKLREAVNAPPTANTIDIQITKANITKYLEGYNAITLPVYDPGTAFFDTLQNRSDSARTVPIKPKTTPKPRVRRKSTPKQAPVSTDPPPLKPRNG